jgi:hypothetical protein
MKRLGIERIIIVAVCFAGVLASCAETLSDNAGSGGTGVISLNLGGGGRLAQPDAPLEFARFSSYIVTLRKDGAPMLVVTLVPAEGGTASFSAPVGSGYTLDITARVDQGNAENRSFAASYAGVSEAFELTSAGKTVTVRMSLYEAAPVSISAPTSRGYSLNGRAFAYTGGFDVDRYGRVIAAFSDSSIDPAANLFALEKGASPAGYSADGTAGDLADVSCDRSSGLLWIRAGNALYTLPLAEVGVSNMTQVLSDSAGVSSGGAVAADGAGSVFYDLPVGGSGASFTRVLLKKAPASNPAGAEDFAEIRAAHTGAESVAVTDMRAVFGRLAALVRETSGNGSGLRLYAYDPADKTAAPVTTGLIPSHASLYACISGWDAGGVHISFADPSGAAASQYIQWNDLTPLTVSLTASSAAELASAIAAIPANGAGAVAVTGDFALSSAIAIDGGKSVTIIPDSTNHTISADTGYMGSLFSVSGGGRLALGGNGSATLTIDGGGSANCGSGSDQTKIVVSGAGSELVINDGATITNCYVGADGENGVSGNAGFVCVSLDSGASLTMNGGSITGNTLNTFTNQSGMVNVPAGCTFVMRGGSINNNVAANPSGANHSNAVYLGGTFIMEDDGDSATPEPEIAYNDIRQHSSSVVYMTGGVFTMRAGSIHDNNATGSDGALHNWGNGIVIEMNLLGGSIYNNGNAEGTSDDIRLTTSDGNTGRAVMTVGGAFNISEDSISLGKGNQPSTNTLPNIAVASALTGANLPFKVNIQSGHAAAGDVIVTGTATCPLNGTENAGNTRDWFDFSAITSPAAPVFVAAGAVYPYGAWIIPGDASNETELASAIAAIPANGSGVVLITGDFAVTSTIAIDNGKTVTLTVPAGSAAISRSASLTTGGIFSVAAGAALNLGDGAMAGTLKLDGGAAWSGSDPAARTNSGVAASAPVISVAGTMEMNANTQILNNANDGTGTESAGGVYIAGTGTLTMNGGLIDSCSTATGSNGESGGGITVRQGAFTMNGGTISNNYATGTWSGGGISAYNGTVTINDGRITENKAPSGGGIFAAAGSNKTYIYGGTISNNTATTGNGGGVCMHQVAALYLSGGVISGNSAPNGNGGGICNNYYTDDIYGVMTLSGGEVTGNTARTGGGVYNDQVAQVSTHTASNAGNGWSATDQRASGITWIHDNSPQTNADDDGLPTAK